MRAATSISNTHEDKLMGVFNQHVTAFFAGKIDEVMNDFTEHAIVITPEGVFEGKAQIRQLYRGLLVEFGVINNGDSPGIHIDTLHIREDMLFITWHAESIERRFEFGTDTFIFQQGKFLRQTISYPKPIAR